MKERRRQHQVAVGVETSRRERGFRPKVRNVGAVCGAQHDVLVQSDAQLLPVHGCRVVAPLHVSSAQVLCNLRHVHVGVAAGGDFECWVSRKQMSQFIAFVCGSLDKKEPSSDFSSSFSHAGGNAAPASVLAGIDMLGQG